MTAILANLLAAAKACKLDLAPAILVATHGRRYTATDAEALAALPVEVVVALDRLEEHGIAAGTEQRLAVAELLGNLPAVGKGCTYSVGSDCYAGTIVWVSKDLKSFRWTQDDATCTDFDRQTYTHTPSPIVLDDKGIPAGRLVKLSKVTGRYHSEGGKRAPTVSPGMRRSYRDPSF